MQRRLIPMNKQDFSKVKVQDNDTVIFIGSKFIERYLVAKVGGWLKGHTVIVSVDSLEQVTSNPREKYYKYFQKVSESIENANLNYPDSKIYLVDNSQGEIAKKMFLLYEFQRSTYDKATLGLAFD